MSKQNEIKAFNTECKPFYIVSHDDGSFSLCLSLSSLSDEYEDFGQKAFNDFATERGEPVKDGYGRYNRGSGYDWQAACKKAFESHPNINEIKFDSEAGGFFCYSYNLEALKDIGKKFKDLAEDTEEFTMVISEGIKQAEDEQAKFEKIRYKVMGRLLENLGSSFDIKTVDGIVHLEPEEVHALVTGELQTIIVGNREMDAMVFLSQNAVGISKNLFAENTYQLITDEAADLQRTQYQENEETTDMTQQMM